MQKFTQLLPFFVLTLVFGSQGAFAQGIRVGANGVVQSAPPSQMLIAAVDTLCASWHVCLTDTAALKSVALLNDPTGSIVKPPRIFRNAIFDPSLYPAKIVQIKFNEIDTAACFDVFPNNPLDSAYAPLFISDIHGDGIVIDLFYPSQRIRRSVLPNLPKRIDTLYFPHTKIGDETCSTFVYINNLVAGAKNLSVKSVSMKKGGEYRVSSVAPKLPAVIKPGDTLKVQVCYQPKNLGISNDSALVSTDCYISALMVTGIGGAPSMLAGDVTFPQVEIDSSNWQLLTIKNDGDISYNLTKSWTLSEIVNFSVDPLSNAQLPKLLKPKDSIDLKIYFHPKSIGHDTARIDWKTDVDKNLTIIGKTNSLLIGEGIPTKNNAVNFHSEDAQSFSIHPNPSLGNSIICSFTLPLESSASLVISDQLGRIVYKRALLSGLSQIEIPTGELSEGVFYAQITSKSGTLSQSFVRVK